MVRRLIVPTVVVMTSWMAMFPAEAATPDVVVTPPDVHAGELFVVTLSPACDTPEVTVAVPDLGLAKTGTTHFSFLTTRDAAVGTHPIVVTPEACGYGPASVTVTPPADPTVSVSGGAVVWPGSQFGITIAPGNCFAPTLDIAIEGTGLHATVVAPSNQNFVSAFFTAPAQNGIATYPVVVSAEGCEFPQASLTVVAPLQLVKTVGIEPGVCADTTAITVAAGTTVYYCYTMTNVAFSGGRDPSWSVSFSVLTDDELGPIFTDPWPFPISVMGSTTGLYRRIDPGETINTVELGYTVTAVATETVTNTATWTAGTFERVGMIGVRWVGASADPASATVTVTPAVNVTPAFTG